MFLRNIVIVFLLTFGCIPASQATESDFIRNNYPKFEEVYQSIILKLRNSCDDCSFGIAKKKDGYHLTITPKRATSSKSSILVWDRSTLQFVDFTVDTLLGEALPNHTPPEELHNLLQLSEKYNNHLYYGYNGWLENSRAILLKEDKTAPESLELLAQSYMEEAAELAHPGLVQRFIDYSGLFRDLGYASVGNTQRRMFESAANKALEHWKKLKRDHPNYICFNGFGVDLEFNHAYMELYQLAQSIQSTSLARTYQKNTYYDQVWVQYSKNLLDACSKNSILITSGSRMTYPLLFAQEKLGIREDVVVLDYSMLQLPWYWEKFKADHSDIRMHFNSKTYQTFADHSVYVDGEMIAAPFSQWLENMVNTNTSAYYTIPSDLYLNHRGTTMQLELKSTTLELADILSLDLISSNAERHFYIGAPYTFARLGLYNYLAPTGRSFELSPNKKAAIGQLNTIENIEDLALFSTVAYFDAIGPIAAEEFSLLSFLVINTAPEFRKRQEALVAKIEKQLPVKQVVALENFPLIESVSAFYEVLQPTSCTELQQLFKPLAEDAIFNTSPLSKNLEDQLSKLEHIFSVYAHFRVFDVDKTTESYTMSHTVSPLERNVLVQLESKVEALLKSPAIQHQNWILRRLKRLETAFLQLPLD